MLKKIMELNDACDENFGAASIGAKIFIIYTLIAALTFAVQCRKMDGLLDQGYAVVNTYGQSVTEDLCAKELYRAFHIVKIDDDHSKIIVNTKTD